jgi:hypothetical protein
LVGEEPLPIVLVHPLAAGLDELLEGAAVELLFVEPGGHEGDELRLSDRGVRLHEGLRVEEGRALGEQEIAERAQRLGRDRVLGDLCPVDVGQVHFPLRSHEPLHVETLRHLKPLLGSYPRCHARLVPKGFLLAKVGAGQQEPSGSR